MFLTGTKNMCYEGGCGTCIVCVATKHPVTNEDIKFAVNSVSFNFLFISQTKLLNFVISLVFGFYFLLSRLENRNS